jgi:lipoprotein-anchoring transpeptidase ErfK/SrfK
MDSLLIREAPGVLRLDHLSRREFLRWTQKGLAGLFALAVLDQAVGKERIAPAQSATGGLGSGSQVTALFNEAPEKGRVLDNTVSVYNRPSFSAKLVNMYWRDLVFPINGVTIGDQYPDHNRVWYMINNEGYAHSGKVQPVALRYNKPVSSIPKRGLLAEVTVPYTDAVKDPNRPSASIRIAYRLYYSTVFWILEVITGKDGQKWYRVPDDKYKNDYYVRAEHLCPVAPADLAPISPHIPAKEKRLEIRLGEQVVVAYEGGQAVFMALVASGARFIDGDYRTKPGRYITNRKRPSRHMASGDLAAPTSYDLPGVPWVSYLTEAGISFHGTYWHNDFGKMRSHGCINLLPQAARWIYRWSNPAVPYEEQTWTEDEGTQVDVIE